jgi:lipopolysaccharide export system permease protein
VILFRYVAARALFATLAAQLGVLAIYLAVDFVDNAGAFTGPGWARVALELYANKAPVVAYQTAPAALLLGAAIAASGLRQTREWIALRSVGLGPWRLAAPVLAVALLMGGGMAVLNDVVGVRSAERAEEILGTRFVRGGAARRWQATRQPKRWFRSPDGRRVYHLRGTLPGGGFEGATILEIGPEFTLARRIDAAAMRPADGAWVLSDVEDRTFLADGGVRVERAAERRYELSEPPEAFALVPGRPSQLRLGVLTSQIALRRQLGQRVADFELERHGRGAAALMGVPAALLAVALALRANRRGHVATSLLEAVGVSLALWAAQGIALAMGLSGRVAPGVAAWAPFVLFSVAGLFALRRVR